MDEVWISVSAFELGVASLPVFAFADSYRELEGSAHEAELLA